MQREESVERGITGTEVAHDPGHQRIAHPGNRAEQGDDHLGAPERHVAPGQDIAHEGLGHQREEQQHAEQPTSSRGFLNEPYMKPRNMCR